MSSSAAALAQDTAISAYLPRVHHFRPEVGSVKARLSARARQRFEVPAFDNRSGDMSTPMTASPPRDDSRTNLFC